LQAAQPKDPEDLYSPQSLNPFQPRAATNYATP
jgi:hypothetical protein